VLQTTSQGLRLISPLAGAGLYTAIGGHGVTVVNSGLFAVAAVLLALVRVTESKPMARAARFRDDLLAGIRHVRSVPLLVQLTVTGGIACGVVGLLETVAFAVIDQGLHRPPSFYGVLEAVQGAGAVLGGITAARLLRRLGEARTVGVGLIAIGVGVAAMVPPSVGLVLFGMALLGAGVPWFVVGWSTGLQRHTPARLQGRVNAIATMTLSVPQTVSVGLGASLIAVVDYRVLLMVIGVGMFVAAAAPLLRPASTTSSKPQVNDLARETVG